MQKYFVKNIVNSDSIHPAAEIVIRNGVISEINQHSRDFSLSDSYHYCIPGFIDMHTHGGDSLDVMDTTFEALSGIARYHLKNGTTSFIASTVTAPLSKIEALLTMGSSFIDLNRVRAQNGEEASLLGFHLEGPWISSKNPGAHNKSHIIKPSLESCRLIKKYADIISMVTFAYNNSSNDEFLHCLIDHDVIAACGHDDTLDADILHGFKKGISHVTHLYSCTSSWQRKNQRKHLGTSEMALMTKGVSVEVIADKHHITKHFWDFISHNKSRDDIIIVSDSIRAAGLPERPGVRYLLGDIEIIIENGVALIPDKSLLAGSVATMYSMFKTLIIEWGISIQDAVQMTSHNQAKKINQLDRIGHISPGRNADMIFLDKDLNIKKILKFGQPQA